MNKYAFLFAETTLIVGCTAMALVFLILPLPESRGLKKYRISLRFLAGAYFTMALIQFLVVALNLPQVNMMRIDDLIVATIQAPLFTFALITLINPKLISWKYISQRLMPVLLLVVLYALAYIRWKDTDIRTYAELKLYALRPTVIVRELFLLYFIVELGYLTRLFYKQVRLYENEIDNYFADTYKLYLPGVRYSFYAALTVGVCTLLNFFLFSSLQVFLFTIAYALFFLLFGVYYIQYPRTFIRIEPAIYPEPINTEKGIRNFKRLSWAELKDQIMAEKYYLKAGVTIEEMAQHLKIGRTTLSSFINCEEEMNFNLWINSLRVEEAKALLVEYPTYNLTQIAEMIGYSESSNFSRQFKLITNESPSVWRQTCQS